MLQLNEMFRICMRGSHLNVLSSTWFQCTQQHLLEDFTLTYEDPHGIVYAFDGAHTCGWFYSDNIIRETV